MDAGWQYATRAETSQISGSEPDRGGAAAQRRTQAPAEAADQPWSRVGVVEKQALLDLCYQEDVHAETDANFVINNNQGIVEIQGTAEENDFSRDQLSQMLDLAMGGCQELHQLQKQTLSPLGIEPLMEKK